MIQNGRKVAGKKLNEAIELIGIELIIVIVFVIGLLFTLNYFGIVPLSKLAPDFLSFLPEKEEAKTPQDEGNKSQNVQSETGLNVTPTIKLLFPCPISRNDCKSGGQPIFDENTDIAGFAYKNVLSQSQIISMMAGSVRSSEIENGHVKITIVSDDDIGISYEFSGKTDVITNDSVNQGDVIGTIDNGVISTPFSPIEFSLFITVKNNITGQVIPLIPDTNEGLKLYGESNEIESQ